MLLHAFGGQAFGAGEEEIGVGAGVADEFAPGEFDDGGGDAVEEVAVVGDEEAGAGVARQEDFEPLDSFGVEVVGGFVEDEEVGLGDEGAAEGDAAFFAAGEGADDAFGIRGVEVVHEAFGAALEIPAVEVGDRVEEGGAFGAVRGCGLVAGDEVEDVFPAVEDVFEDGGTVVEVEDLGEVAGDEVALAGEGS